MLTSRSLAIAGNRPTMMNSVVSTVKPAADNRRMGNNRMHNSRKTKTPAIARRPTGRHENEDGES
ncbi:hypothetical protein D9M73_195910 [compost metagenome]